MNVVKGYENDAILLLGLRNQVNASYHFLYKNYFSMIKDFVTNNNGTYDEAKDVFQECIISLSEKLYKSEIILTCSLKTYFFSMCKFNWLNKLRDKKKYSTVNFDDFDIIEDVKNDSFEEIKFEKLNLVNELGEKCQEILKQFYYQKLSMQIIAENLKYTNAENVKVQKYKCIEQLKKKIKIK